MATTPMIEQEADRQQTTKAFDSRTVFLLGLLVAGSGLLSPPIALVGGVAFGFMVVHPLRTESAKLAKLLLQASVVALGFGMNLREVVRAGRSGFAYTAISISVAMALGLLLGRLLKVGGKASYLITAGTAICGGSAIAAISPITLANEEEISVSMGTVFLLNSIALLLFPVIGHLLHLDQNQFGLWAALAIHDTSSVVGAAATYGGQALAVGTTVKLARALWIVPVSLLTAAFMAQLAKRSGDGGKRGSVTLPWFILMFVAAAALSTYLPRLQSAFAAVNHLGKLGLTATLFLIGSSLSRKTLQQVGVRPLVQGVVLWTIVEGGSLAAIYFRIISI
ncbi:YeiH family protein [Granulicella paludicola]|uniref:YeiH family protein n=1 Tax=Granulicella paludicola TaxID=474951 RepID=UPI0021E031B4|nr:putative sulfate exporter family transporter [Granulicella paludicola]